jgi:hypothetical protein
MTQPAAEAYCQTQGGHLAAYRSAAQQRQVEQAFVGDGYLLPFFHAAYHVGLEKAGASWNYTDFFYRSSRYQPWATGRPSGAGVCAVANTRTLRNGIYVFNDGDCATQRPFICLIHRKLSPLRCP